MKIIQDKEIVEFIFDKNIDYKLYLHFNEIELLCESKISQVYLSFANTQFITLPGSIYIIFLLYRIKLSNNYFETRFLTITESVLSYLVKFGFFDSSVSYCNLKTEKKIDSLLPRLSKMSSTSYYWPIRTVPPNSGSDFETSSISLMNDYSEFINLIMQKGLVNTKLHSYDEIRSRFNTTVYELIKNIWDHSDSWGLSSIQSTRVTGTTVCICDYGVGFVESYKKRNADYKDYNENYMELIESQLLDNFSSKSKSKYGHGLWRVKQFVNMIEGVMFIKTSCYNVVYNGKTKKQIISDDIYTIGSQIFINF